MEDVSLRGIAHRTDVVKIALVGVPDSPGVAAKVFTSVGKLDVSINLIVQAEHHGGRNDIAFLVSTTDLPVLRPILDDLVKSVDAERVVIDEKLATVSLVVGGIGIMNVMLVSVTERTREIGVRLAVGAHPGDIVTQFLLEAVLISLGGGLLGIAAGVLAIPLASSLNQGRALLDPQSIPLALGVAVLTGIAFGLYPAVRAARLNPIEALRYE